MIDEQDFPKLVGEDVESKWHEDKTRCPFCSAKSMYPGERWEEYWAYFCNFCKSEWTVEYKKRIFHIRNIRGEEDTIRYPSSSIR